MKKTERSSAGLREHLFGLIDQLIEGKITPNEATSHARLAQQIFNSVRIELDAARFVSEMGAGKATERSLPKLSL